MLHKLICELWHVGLTGSLEHFTNILGIYIRSQLTAVTSMHVNWVSR
jgi:hypothetical protein